MEKPSFFERLVNWSKRSVTLKLFSVGFIILMLLIPTSMLQSLINEREGLRDSATNEVSSKWGNAQKIGGPVISVPYTAIVTEGGEKITRDVYAHFLPDELSFTGELIPEERNRGIFSVILYRAKIHVKGEFKQLNVNALTIPNETLRWEDAFLTLKITDLTGIRENIRIRLNDSLFEAAPGLPTADLFGSGINTPFTANPDQSLKFEFDLDLNGSSSLYFLPFGKQTHVSLNSSWNNPSFEGAFLPDTRNVKKDGFSAQWKVLQLNRNYPQQGIGTFIQVVEERPTSRLYDEPYYIEVSGGDQSGGFGVRLLLPVDEYQKTMRSAKYSAIFIILTFTMFFFVEVLNKRKIHPIQYLLVGLAICLFYLLLLSISEHLSFDWAYLIAGLSILGIITVYLTYTLQTFKQTALVAGVLAVLYGFFYSLLQMQDYALLLGSLGLFLILAVIMWITRRVNWYNVSREEEEVT